MPTTTPTILVIDNDEGLCRAIATRLERHGYECVLAGTGAQGIAVFQERHIDLVISDLNMPIGNGVALATTLRETSAVPIIIVTGYHDHYRRELRAIPGVTVMQKPFDSTQLVDLVETELVMAGCELPSRSRSRARV